MIEFQSGWASALWLPAAAVAAGVVLLASRAVHGVAELVRRHELRAHRRRQQADSAR